MYCVHRQSAYVPTLGDISRRGALPALAELARNHPKPLGAMAFARASGVDAGTAGRVRDEMIASGLIEAKIAREQGAVTEYEIRLTPLGLEIGRHLVAIDGVLARAGKRDK